jgi:hypothetical protein
MPLSESAARTLRAAAEVFVPGAPNDATIGAPEVHAELFISHYLDYLLPGLASGVPTLLDGLAAELFDGRAFAELDLSQREDVFDALARHDVEQLREIPGLLGLLSVSAVYGEWTGQDEEGRLVRAPVGWSLTGFDGPSRGRPHLMRRPQE